MKGPAVAVGVLACAVAAALLGASALGGPAGTSYPRSIAALGDSITRAVNAEAAPGGAAARWSWATGSAVPSHYRRLLARTAGIGGNAYNDAVSGATMSGLDAQAAVAVGQNADYVTILMGANDVCAPSERTMTRVSAYRSQFERALRRLSRGLPEARIYVVSIPDVHRLWSILKGHAAARAAWQAYRSCQALLARPLSRARGDAARRARVRRRNIAFNAVLEAVCRRHARCRFDGHAVFKTRFVAADVSTLDYFHPSVAGQKKLAAVSWRATFAFG